MFRPIKIYIPRKTHIWSILHEQNYTKIHLLQWHSNGIVVLSTKLMCHCVNWHTHSTYSHRKVVDLQIDFFTVHRCIWITSGMHQTQTIFIIRTPSSLRKCIAYFSVNVISKNWCSFYYNSVLKRWIVSSSIGFQLPEIFVDSTYGR